MSQVKMYTSNAKRLILERNLQPLKSGFTRILTIALRRPTLRTYTLKQLVSKEYQMSSQIGENRSMYIW